MAIGYGMSSALNSLTADANPLCLSYAPNTPDAWLYPPHHGPKRNHTVSAELTNDFPKLTLISNGNEAAKLM